IRKKNRLMFLRESDDRRWHHVESEKCLQRGADLPASAIDHHEIREKFPFFREPSIPATDNFFHGAEIIVADEALDLKTPIVVFVRPAVRKMYHRCDDERAGDVRDIETLDCARGAWQRQRFAQKPQRFLIT